MKHREQAIMWATEQIKNQTLISPIKVNAWETIDNPLLFLQTSIARLQHGSEREQRAVYQRIRNLKQKLNEQTTK
jgi:hypothetical protein